MKTFKSLKEEIVESTDVRKSKSVKIGNQYYILPFKTSGFWVEDSKRNNVAECRSQEVAADLAKILNEKYK